MSRLRIALPPLHQLTSHTEFEWACLDQAGRVIQTGVSTLSLLEQESRAQAVECFLHPADSVLTRLQLPPLSATKIAAAVACAAQALILGGSEQMHVAHSAREGSGEVCLAWLAKADLQRLGELLSQYRLKLRGLYPAPYALPVPLAGQISACVLDGQLLLRLSAEQASVEPMVDERLQALLAGGSAVQWIGDDMPAAVLEHKPADQRWAGAAPGWGLHGGIEKTAEPTPVGGRTVFCCALAVAVWVAGLNLYAAREASQGQQIKAQMSERVKQAFPELPVILNPLQQARQQLATRQSGAATGAGDGFAYLVQNAASAMPFMAGSVQRLTFDQGRLQVELAADTPHISAEGSVTGALSQAGLAAVRDDNVWTLSAQVEPESADSGAIMDNDDE